MTSGFTSFSLKSSGTDQRNYGTGTLTVGDGTNVANNTLPVAFAAASITGTLTGTGTVIATSGSVANSDYMVIGTWTAGTWTAGPVATVTSTGFAAGIPTASFTSVTGKRATYNLLNATPVYTSIGSTPGALTSASLNVDFAAATSFVGVDLSVSLPGQSYNLKGGVVGTGSGFTGKVSMSNPDCIAGAGANTCGLATINGGFSGPNAQNAMLAFAASSLVNGNFGGAASLTQSVAPVTIPISNTLTDLRINLSDNSQSVVGQTYATGAPSTVTSTFMGQRLTGFSDRNSATSSTLTIKDNNASPGAYGAIGTVSSADFVGWGNWITSEKKNVRDSPPCTAACTTIQALDSVHYIVGRPTASMPMTGTANYQLAGSTAPTSTLLGTGQLVSANMNANFGLGTASVSVNALFGGSTTVAFTQGVTFTPGSPTFSGSNASTTVSGFFSGSNAYRAAAVYGTSAVSAAGQVSGAVVFQKN